MDPISLSSIAVSSISIAANALRPTVLKRLGSEPDTFLRVLRTCLVPKVDVVCIPDLNEDPLQEWIQPIGSGNVNWLTDLLPLSFPDARILLFGYTPKTRTPDGFTRQTIFAQAYELLRHLWRRRRGIAERRPLVFLVHNSGVLIARTALIQSSAAFTERDAHFRSIYLSTGAVITLDAPKQHENLSQSWRDILDKATSKVPHTMLKDANLKDRSTEWFKWQQDRYRAIAPTIITTTVIVKRNPRTRSTTGQRLLAAATAYKNMKFLGDHARIVELEKEGFSLTQYGSASEAAYQDLVDNIGDSMEIGASLSKAKWILDSLRKSFSFMENDEWVSEAQKEYDRQLEHTAAIEREWLAELEPESSPLVEQNKLEQPKYQRRLSRASLLQRNPSTQSIGTDVPSMKTQNDVSTSTKEQETSSKTTETPPDRISRTLREASIVYIAEVPPDTRLKQIDLAEQLMRRVEGEYGFLHARTLECLSTLATRNIEVDLLETAESIMQRLLVSWECAFGPHNTKVLYAVQQVAAIKSKQHKWADASTYLTKAIDVRTKLIIGLDHKLKIERKKPPTQQDSKVVEDLTGQMSHHHRATAKCQIDLAVSYDMQERYREAEPLYTQVLHTQKDPTGECRLLCLENQAIHWRKTGALAKAAANYTAILKAYELKTPPGGRRERKAIELKLKEVKDAVGRNIPTNSYF